MAPKFACWFLTGQQGDAAELPGSDEPDSACKRPPDTPSVDVFCCRGRSPDLQVAVVPLAFPLRNRISGAWIGNNSLLTVAGAVPDFRAPCAIHRLPS